MTRLGALPGVRSVSASSLTGNALLQFDPTVWSTSELLGACGEALDLPVQDDQPTRANGTVVTIHKSPRPGRARLAVPGLRRRPERAGPLERRLLRVTGVRQARASAWTGNALVEYDPALCTLQEIESACLDLDRSLGDARLDRPGPVAAPAPAGQEQPTLSAAAPAVPWHALDVAEVVARLGVDPARGLTAAEAAERLRRHGPNRMPEPNQPSLVRLLVDQLVNAPTALLGAGMVVSILTGGLLEAGLIALVLGTNAAVGAATERTGHRAIAALSRSAATPVRVRRDGQDLVLDSDQLVPGDTIQFVPGDPVPADARVVEANRLTIEESALTGESRAVDKLPIPVDPRLALADRRSMMHRGTTVVGGRGRALVVATGADTVIGQLHLLAAGAEAPPTPMERDLDRLGKWLAYGASGICVGILGLGVLRSVPLLYSLEVAVSLGVAAIPEGLPALATSVLALASGRMRRKGTLIRSLGAAEALGSVTVVCADKTGTLTENRMAAQELYSAGRVLRIGGAALQPVGAFEHDGRPISPLDDPATIASLLVGVLCSDAELESGSNGELVIDGSATEGALQVAAVKAGLETADLRERHPRLDLRERSDGRRHMVTVHRLDDELIALMKGSPEEVLDLCDTALGPNGVTALTEADRLEIGQVNAGMAGRAMRVLGLARRVLPDGYAPDELARGYTFLGLIGLVDPIRPAVPDAIRALHEAGIRTVMITGDQALTAVAVARELGLSRRGSLNVLEAGDLDRLDREALRGLVRDVGIFARVAPEMKLAVVRAFQANGKVVAMTGDGVNDGPALRAADVGVGMGERGSELARELADVVLSTDDFTQMVDAVEEGRLVRANVRRVLHYMLSTNASEVWVVAVAVAAGLPSPLTPLQLLWLNLVTDLAPGLGLAVEPREPDLMQRPPRESDEPLIPRPLLQRIVLESGLIAGGAITAYGLGILRHGFGPVAQTMAFASLLGAQLLHIPLARAGEGPATIGKRPANRWLTIGTALSAGLQLVALFVPPVRAALGGAALGPIDLALAALGAVVPIASIELQRRWSRHRQATPAAPTLRALPAPAL
jgi:Ca2+-transporting ATPase